jgi:predicted dehydrogenase
LQAGIHVFCEKPPGRSKEDVELMLEEERKNPGIKLKFGFNHRYHQAVLDAKALVDRGRLGRILWVRGVYGKGGGNRYDRNWRNQKDLSGGGILIDQGIHMVDLFRLFCGDFDEVQSFIERLHWPVEVEDNAFVLMRNQKKQVAMLHSSATQWQYKFLLEICLEKGNVTISGILSSTRNYGTETLKIARCVYDEEGYPIPNPEETISYYDEDRSWMMELEEFISCIKEGTPIKVGSCREAYQTMLLIEKIYEADERWKRSASIKGENYENSSFG